MPHARGADDVVGILIRKHVVVDGGTGGRIVGILFARSLIGEVGALACIGVIWGEGGGIGLRRDLAQGGFRGFNLIRPVHLVELLLYVLKDVVGTLVRRRRGFYPRRGEERPESWMVHQISWTLIGPDSGGGIRTVAVR